MLCIFRQGPIIGDSPKVEFDWKFRDNPLIEQLEAVHHGSLEWTKVHAWMNWDSLGSMLRKDFDRSAFDHVVLKDRNQLGKRREEYLTLADHQLVFFSTEHDDLSDQIGERNALIHLEATRRPNHIDFRSTQIGSHPKQNARAFVVRAKEFYLLLKDFVELFLVDSVRSWLVDTWETFRECVHTQTNQIVQRFLNLHKNQSEWRACSSIGEMNYVGQFSRWCQRFFFRFRSFLFRWMVVLLLLATFFRQRQRQSSGKTVEKWSEKVQCTVTYGLLRNCRRRL